MPTAVAIPCPSGPVVVSTPGVWPYSGWPASRAPLPEGLDVIEADIAAGEIQQCIEQHRAMARRQHEAVAVRPIVVRRVEFQEAREQHGGDIGHAHGQAGMAGLRGLDGVDREEADGVGEIVVRDRGRGRLRRGRRCSSDPPLVHFRFRLRSISCMISGVRISCIARSSFAPGHTIELARDIQLCGSIESR